MRKIIGTRGSGKTTKLVKKALLSKGVILTNSERRKTDILMLMSKLDQKGNSVLYYENRVFVATKHIDLEEIKSLGSPIFIDDTEQVLQTLFNNNLECFTISIDTQKPITITLEELL